MSNDIVIRRATADDYENVINIVDDLWDGADYLPTLYHVFRQTKQHVFYVAEVQGRVVINAEHNILSLHRPTDRVLM